MKGNKKFALLYVILAIMVSAGAVIFQHILKNSYTDKNGLYTAGVVTPELFLIYVVLSALLLLTVVFLLRFDILPSEMKKGTVNTAAVSAVTAVALVFAAIMFFMSNASNIYMSGSSELMVYRLKIASSIAAFPAALYLLTVVSSGKGMSKITPYLSFFPLVWTLCLVMSIYFDRGSLINSPAKSLQQFALVLLVIYQLYEIRAYIGRSKMLVNFILSLQSTLFLSAAFVPTVIDIVMGTEKLNSNNAYCVLGALMSLYTLSRAIDFAFNSEIDISKIIMERRREEQQKADAHKSAVSTEEKDETCDGSEVTDLLNSLETVADSGDGALISEDAVAEETAEEDTEETTEEIIEKAPEENEETEVVKKEIFEEVADEPEEKKE